MKLLKVRLLILIAVLLLFGCTTFTGADPTQRQSETVPLDETITAVTVNVNANVGELNIHNGSQELMEADFLYNKEELKPTVTYDAENGRGQLTVAQAAEPNFNLRPNMRSEWDLAFNPETPLAMQVTLGAGDADLTLAGLNLTHLDVDTGVGAARIDLSGAWEQSFDVTVDGGIGEITVILPRDVGVRASGDIGIGEIEAVGLTQQGDVYTNTAYGQSPVTINLNVEGSMGEINLRLAD